MAPSSNKFLQIEVTSSLSSIEQALSFIDPTDRDTWIKCGMAINSEVGDSGFDIWNRWSANSGGYDKRAALSSWKGFGKRSRGITIATLFRLAMDNGYVHNSNDRPTPLTPEQIAARQASKDAEIALTAKHRADAAAQAEAIWNEKPNLIEAGAPAVSEHPYLVKKGIQPQGAKVYRGSLTIGGMDCNGALMIPSKINGKITTLQFISKDTSLKDNKRFIFGGEKGWYVIGKIEPDGKVCIAEGFATAASIHEATGYPVVVCFDAGNMQKVAEALRLKMPGVVIVLCADDDSAKGDTGLKAANRSALAVNGLVAVTVWGADRTAGANDFNDMTMLFGFEAVKLAIDAAQPVVQQAVGCDFMHSGDGGNSWPTPQSLTAKFEAEPYPIEALPDTIRAAVEEVIGFVKAPVALAASSAIAAVSLATQALYDVERASMLHSPVSLFMLTIAGSGERKSTCDGFFTSQIRGYATAQAEAAKPAIKDYKASLEIWESKRCGIKDKIRQEAKGGKATAQLECELYDLTHDEPEAPRIPRLMYSDVTPEELARKLAKVWPSGGVVSAEAGVVFGSHSMGKDSAMRNLALLNTLWDGAAVEIDRKTTESFTVRGARLTMGLQVQEETINTFLAQSGALARGTGFLARFLLAWPESTQGKRPFTESPENWPCLSAFNLRIGEILNQAVPIDENGSLSPQMLTLNVEAKQLWVEYHDAIESELARDGQLFDVRDVASKSADNATRLAALFHVFEGGVGAISADAFDRASQIAFWHLSESLRFFGELVLPSEMADAIRLDKWLIAYCRSEKNHFVGKRYAQRSGAIRDGSRLDEAIKELESLGRVQLRKDGKQLSIWINPALLADGCAS